MIEKRKVKFFQIVASHSDILYGLDGQGQIWRYGPLGINPILREWSKIDPPEEEVKQWAAKAKEVKTND